MPLDLIKYRRELWEIVNCELKNRGKPIGTVDGNSKHAPKGAPGSTGGQFVSEGGRGTPKSEKRKGNVSESNFFGEEIKGDNLKDNKAIELLIKEQHGHIKGAFHRDDIGDIDLVWGDKDAGLCHIITSRAKNNQNLSSVLNAIPLIIKYGTPSPNNDKIDYTYGEYKASVRLDYDRQKKNWLLTSFIIDRK
jgi:hypothetical protein